MAILNNEEIEHIARLARLRLTEEEKSKFARELSSILEYVAKLQSVPTDDIEPLAYMLNLKNITREDRAEDCGAETKKFLISDMPDRNGDLLRVPAVFEAQNENL